MTDSTILFWPLDYLANLLDAWPLVSLFLLAFLAATLLPAASEVFLLALYADGFNPLTLWFAATAGNTLGACVNYYLGRYLRHFEGRRWFPFSPHKLGRSQIWFQKYGVWSLLFAWLPILGDALTFIAGIMKVPFLLFLVLTTIGKGARYAVILGLVQLWIT